MKKALLSLIAFIFLLNLPFSVYAAVPKQVDKLSKGAIEIVKSPLELYDHTKKDMDQSDHKLIGFFKGLVSSPFYLVKKAGHGALDVATFPIE